MATITPRYTSKSRPSWQAKVRRLGYPPQSKTFDSKAKAEAWVRQVEGEMDRGAFIPRAEAESTTLMQLLDRYLEEVTPGKRGAIGERSHLRMIRQDPVGRCFVGTITGRDLAAYKARRLKAVSASTLNRELNILSHVFTVAAQEWHIHLPWGNPVRLVSRPRVQDKRERRLVGDELPRLMSAALAYGGSTPHGSCGPQCAGGNVGSLITWAIETAMRRGEIAAMRWEHIDRKARVLLIPETKTGTPRRVPLSTVAMRVLERLPRRLDGLVFGMHPASLSRAFAQVCKAAGITGLTFHDLRHEATSRLFEKGLNPMQVAAITGHKTLQMLKRYTHLRAEDLVGMLG